ncbi:MAG: hypothetical protein IJ949_00315, partial [Oscillospiraceae bacterium]|nr:hypothetical protein [Oscillospiraceae bacterium]
KIEEATCSGKECHRPCLKWNETFSLSVWFKKSIYLLMLEMVLNTISPHALHVYHISLQIIRRIQM